MKDVYLRAAELVYYARDEGDSYWNRYTCLAVNFAATGDHETQFGREVNTYVKTFAENQWELQGEFDRAESPKEVRVLALLFMHWISQDEESHD